MKIIKKIVLFIIFLIICLLLRFQYGLYHPYIETCIQSDVLAYDQINNNSVKYIECMKGYAKDMFNSTQTVSQVTGGYVVFDENQNIISTTPLQKYNNKRFKQGNLPNISLGDKGFFITTMQAISNPPDGNRQEIKIYELFRFYNNKIEKVRDILNNNGGILAYENNEIYYIDIENNLISKDNLLTGKISTIIDLSSLERNQTYHKIYGINVVKEKENLIMNFIIHTLNKKQTEYYSLNLNSGEFIKTKTGPLKFGTTSWSPYNLPPGVTYSYTKDTASTYNLDYNTNSQMDIYNFLLLIKKGTTPSIKPY